MVESPGGAVGAPDFQEHLVYATIEKRLEPAFQESEGHPSAAEFGRDRQVQEFGFLAGGADYEVTGEPLPGPSNRAFDSGR